MIAIALFGVAQLLVSGHAIWRGGAPERVAAVLLPIALVGSQLIPWGYYTGVNWPLLWVDIGLFASLTALALVADRFWPLWLAALQLVAVATHGVRGFDADHLALAYWAIVSKIGWVMLSVLVIGTIRHGERRSAESKDYAWTFRRHRKAARPVRRTFSCAPDVKRPWSKMRPGPPGCER